MDVLNTINKCTNGIALGGAGCLIPTGLERFSDSGMTAGVIIMVLVILAIYIMLAVAIYRLTDSGVHAILCLIFGSLYLIIAVIYYGFSGYKFAKAK